MSRGRPSEQVEIIKKYNQVFYEYPSKPELGETTTWYYDLDKSPNGPYKVETTFPKGVKYPKVKIEKNKTYGKMPLSYSFIIHIKDYMLIYIFLQNFHLLISVI